MTARTRTTVIGMAVAVHHVLALYSISAERFSMPLAGFSSTVLFPAILIVNALPLAVAGAIGAMADGMFDNDPATRILFLSAFVIGSTLQWALVGSVVFLLIYRSHRTK